MPASDSRYETDQRDVKITMSSLMPQDAPSGINTLPSLSISSSSGSQPSFDRPIEPREDLSQHNDCSYSQEPDSIVYNPIPINDVQQKAASSSRSNYNAGAYFLLVTNWWWLEIVGLVLCILSLMATVIILDKYNGKPINDWPYKITLNAVISVVATMTQMALMLPVTSSLSQLKWLWFNEKPHPLADFEFFDSASRGAWGSLLLLGRVRSMHWASLGAITSILALTMPPFTQQLLSFESVLVPTTAASINSALNFTQYKGARASIYYGTLPQSMLAAIYSGLLNSDITLSDVTPNCQTGNCTWRLYSSLGVCASVANITSTVTVTCPDDTDSASVCRYSVPGGAYLNSQAGKMMNVTAMGDLSSVAVFDVIAISPVTDQYVAYEASLKLCVQTLNSTVRDGRHNTAITQQVIVPTRQADRGSTNTTVNGTVFTVNNPSITAMRQSISELFSGDVLYTVQETHPSTLVAEVIWEKMFLNANGTLLEGMNQHGIENFIGSLARSISNAFRTPIIGNNDIQPIQGVGYSSVSFVRVQWLWLIPPVIVTILGAMLLIATIVASSRSKIKIWKSSSVAVLAALQSLPRSELGTLEMVTSMDNRAKDVCVVLDVKDKGLKLFKPENS
ncbi:hypothetical protein V494_00432 [Pseudogymnoascus sp. VKM F-4513 (FW-928)]|nr:hypothetical protein V494_00432 [Pseudogymnoascus sp. VKM F-4513 (FW-928)]